MATTRPRMARPVISPFRLLEITIISAQDLAPIAKTMRTYAVAWVNPERKLTTRVDQNGHCHPTWNEKFVFRVDDKFLTCEDSSIMIEIYTAAWLRDVLVGSVNVLISNLFMDHYNNYRRGGGGGSNHSSTTRFVTLQIRRPSGRPQGILNMGFTLLDTTMKSMPLYSELSVSADGVPEFSDSYVSHNRGYNNEDNHHNRSIIKLRRTQSDRTDLTMTDDTFGIKPNHNHNFVGSVCNGSSMVSENKGSGSMVNSSLCNSDVGPSASVVAAAIAKGLIKTPGGGEGNKGQCNAAGSSILGGWTRQMDEGEELKTKLERWRTELPAVYDHHASNKHHSSRNNNKKKKRKHKRRQTDGGLFSCFGNAFGCEISITCGGGSSKRYPKNANKNGKVCHLSSVDDNYSQSYV